MPEAAAVLPFDAALALVLAQAGRYPRPETKEVPLLKSVGWVLAEAVTADRDQPPFDRATKDGFAVGAAEFSEGRRLRVTGEIRAGERWDGPSLAAGTAIAIMTGAAMPPGADAVAMIEDTERSADHIQGHPGKGLRAGENLVVRGREAQAGSPILLPGSRIGASEIALAATCGRERLKVFARPTVAIVATGDELVELHATPEAQQIRNSNSYALAALVEAAGCTAMRMTIAPDLREEIADRVVTGRTCDVLLLSGGVSMGKYDLVEEVLAGFGAEFFFTGVRMQPGKPVVFGRLPERSTGDHAFPERLFFGLPGNPVSTQVTFHCFVEPLLRAISGEYVAAPRFVQATLGEEVATRSGAMRLLPARLSSDRSRPEVKLVPWQGSGDLAANGRANCYVVLPPDRDSYSKGDVVTVLLR